MNILCFFPIRRINYTIFSTSPAQTLIELLRKCSTFLYFGCWTNPFGTYMRSAVVYLPGLGVKHLCSYDRHICSLLGVQHLCCDVTWRPVVLHRIIYIFIMPCACSLDMPWDISLENYFFFQILQLDDFYMIIIEEMWAHEIRV